MAATTLDLGVSDVHADSVDVAKPARKSKKNKTKPLKGVRVRAHLGIGGTLSVRHLKDGGDVALLSGIELAAADTAKPVWIQLAKAGAFKGHSAGSFELNATVFSQIVSNFHATANKRIAIDFNHASEQDPAAGTVGTLGTPAQGWIVDMKVDGGNLYGLVEWGVLARDYIKSGAYRFFSPAIRFNSRDRVTGQPIGARMSSGALTNDPFLDGMMPVAASGQFAATTAETLPAIRRAMKLPELASAEECEEQFERLCSAYEMAGGDDVQGMPVASYIASLRAEMGVPLTTRTEDLLADVGDILDEACGTDDDATTGEPMAALDDSEEDMTMTDAKDSAVLLSQTQAQVAEVTLKLSAATAEVLAAKAELAARDEKITALTKAQDERNELDLAAEVDVAILSWGKERGISEKDRGHLLSFRKASPDGFKGLYPERDPVHARLMSRVTPPVKREGVTAPDAVSVVEGEAFCVTLARVRAAQPKLSVNGAYERAYQLRNG